MNFTSFKNIFKFWKFLKKNQKRLSYLILCIAFISSVFEMLVLSTSYPIINLIISNNDSLTLNFYFFKVNFSEGNIYLLYIAYITIILISTFLRSFNVFCSYRYSAYIGNYLSENILTNALMQEYEEFTNMSFSNITTILTQFLDYTVASISLVIQIISNTLICISIFLILFFLNKSITVTALFLLLVIYLVVLNINRRSFKRFSKLITRSSDLELKNLQETLSNIRDIKLNNSYQNYIKAFMREGVIKRASKASYLYQSYTVKYPIEGIILIFFATFALYIRSSSTDAIIFLPTIGVFLIAIQKLLPIMTSIIINLSMISGNDQQNLSVLTYLEKNNIFEKYRYKKLNLESNVKRERKIIFNQLKLENIYFKYKKSEKNTLNNVNLVIDKNSKLAIIGKIGSGKSTLIDIIIGLLKPSKGEIKLNNNNLNYDNQFNILSKCIANISQNIFIYDDTLLNNITIGHYDQKIDHKKLNKAIEIANLQELVKTLPQRENTRLGERGAFLSGGQIQSIGIARAIYKGFSILVLDEATSAMDSKTENIILQNIFKEYKHCCIIVISHKVNPILFCEKFIKIENGKVSSIKKSEIEINKY